MHIVARIWHLIAEAWHGSIETFIALVVEHQAKGVCEPMDTQHPGQLFGLKIRQLRWERNLSLQQLGQRAGITREAVRQIEAGKRPKPITLCLLAEALNTDAYCLAEECGFEGDYLATVWTYLLTDATEQGIPPENFQSQIREMIVYGEELLRCDGVIQLAAERARQALALIRSEEELTPTLVGYLYRAYDLLINIDTRVSGSGDLDEALQLCREMRKLVNDELVPAGVGPEVVARASYRLSDVLKLRQEYNASLDEVETALSKAQSQTLYGEALRTKFGALRHLGDLQELRQAITEAKNALGQMGHFSHIMGCLGQGLALSISLTEQLAALDEIDRLDRLYAEAHRAGFTDHLLEMLFLTRRAQIAALEGPGKNTEMAFKAAYRGLELAEGRYQQIARECESVLSQCGDDKPYPDSPRVLGIGTKAWLRANRGPRLEQAA
jgi:transcriptional regulator with XRE-family HTH domain